MAVADLLGGGSEPPYRLRDIVANWRETGEPAFFGLIGAGMIATSQSPVWGLWPWLAVAGLGIVVLLIALAVIDDRLRRASHAV